MKYNTKGLPKGLRQDETREDKRARRKDVKRRRKQARKK